MELYRLICCDIIIGYMTGLLDWLLGNGGDASGSEEAQVPTPPPVTAETIGDLPWTLKPGDVQEVGDPDVPSIVIGERFRRGDPDGMHQIVFADGTQRPLGTPKIPPEEEVFLQSILRGRERGG